MSGDEKSRATRCEELRQRLLEAHDVGDSLPVELEAHLEACDECQIFRSQLLLLDNATRAQAPELPEGFQLSLRRRLNEKAGRGSSRKGWLRPLAAAAAIAVVVGAVVLAGRWSTDSERRPTYHRLQLSIQSTRDLEEVLFDVDLPRDVRPLSATSQALGAGQHLRWRSAVRRGTNELELPLVARTTTGSVRVRLTAGGQTWTKTVEIGPGAPSAGGRSGGLQLAWMIASPEDEGGAR